MDSRGILEHLAQHGTPAAGVARRIDVGSDLYLTYLEEELLGGFVEQGASACRIFEGEYGAGKTHILQLIAETALARGAAVVQTDLSQSLHLGDWRALVQHILANVEVADSNGDRIRGLPAILDTLDWTADELAELLRVHVPHDGFRAAMHRISGERVADAEFAVLKRFLLGEPVTAAYMRTAGVSGVRGPVSDRNAERVLQTLGIALRALGITSLVVLFDETEHTMSVRAGRREIKAANLMRRLVDGSTNGRLTGILFGFALLPGTIEQAALVYPALGQRIAAMERSRGGIGTRATGRAPKYILQSGGLP